MKTIGYDKPLYVLPFDHRGSFKTKMFGWHGDLTAAQTAEIAAAKQVIYEGFKAAVEAGVPKEKTGILVDEAVPEAFADAIAQAIDRPFDSMAIRRHAEQFSRARFANEMTAVIHETFREAGASAVDDVPAVW